MNRKDLEQIVFNALETERSHTRSEGYRTKVEEAMKQLRSEGLVKHVHPRGVCKECGSQDVDTPCE